MNTLMPEPGPAHHSVPPPSRVCDPSLSRARFRVASFFAGIGGFELGFEAAGFHSVFYCEKDRFCRSVLNRHWPAVQNAKDILEVRPDAVPDAGVWTGGFPCQDVSVARG